MAAWEQFRIHGSARDVGAGTPVTLQQKPGERRVSLPATMRTVRGGAYTLRVRPGSKGENALRIVGGAAVSPVVRTTVH